MQIEAMEKRQFLVWLDEICFYATEWKITGERAYVQSGGASGDNFLTNNALRARQLTLKGYIAFDDDPAAVILPLEKAMREKTYLFFTLRGMMFSSAQIVGYTVEESCEKSTLACTINIVTTSSPTVLDEEEKA